MNKFIITEKENGLRLDKALTIFCPQFSRSYLSNLITDGKIFINEKNVDKPSFHLKKDDVITFELPENTPLDVTAEEIPLDIVYEDDDILIINKSQGMVVHPSHGHYEHTLVNALLAHSPFLSGINGVMRPGIVHRIDKDTSGLICVAKNDHAHHFLAEQLKDHTMHREYLALVKGIINENKGSIDMPIGRDKRNRKKMGINKENGKSAITHFEVIEKYEDATLIRCILVSGRTHQIRVHLSAINHPVEGDPLYYGKHYDRYYAHGQLLTAVKLTLIHPTSQKEMSWEIPLPPYFQEVLNSLKKQG